MIDIKKKLVQNVFFVEFFMRNTKLFNIIFRPVNRLESGTPGEKL